jgi:hypothetical protein
MCRNRLITPSTFRTDYNDVSAPVSHQPVSKGGHPLYDGTDTSPPKRATEEPLACSPSLLARLVDGEGPADFRHPVTVEGQRVMRARNHSVW